MPVCKKCGERFPNRVKIDGKRKVLGNRKYCLVCSPYGKHNTRRLHLPPVVREPRVPDLRTCRFCRREYYYDPKRGHSGTTCNSCLVNRRRYKRKVRAIEYKGGVCVKCGYDGHQCPGAMDFHHRDPSQKDFAIGGTHCLKWERVAAELDKCDMYCCRCHREVEWEMDQATVMRDENGELGP